MGNTILCVDDEQHGLMIRQMLLERVGYSVLTAGNAREGLALFSRRPVDAVVLDYFLPDLDGGLVATAMRLIKPDVPIIMFSVQWRLPEEAGTIADAVLGKGQHPIGLLNTLEQLLRLRHAQSA
ncbi:MAG TPA: response regulator [Terriglobales bacterium]|jgi:CheY-like chemotaxis protein|nr:response regulator [Terriglobales bacterium]